METTASSFTSSVFTPGSVVTASSVVPCSVFDRMIRRIETALHRASTPDQKAIAAADALRPFLGHPGLLTQEQCEPDPERYRPHVLHVAPDGSYSIVALVWMPGQETQVHDHVAWCAFGVHRGAETEVHYELLEEDGQQYLQPVGAVTNRVGAVSALVPPGDIHTVVNSGSELAISIHIYGADVRQVGSSVRHRYDLPVRLTEPILAFAQAMA